MVTTNFITSAHLVVAWLHGDDVYLNFLVESMIHGYHKYKVVWYNPLVGKDLLSEREVGNPHDTYVLKSDIIG